MNTHIDAAVVGNEMRFLNHSCAANLTCEVVRIGGLLPHISFFTKMSILPNTELTFDYASHHSSTLGTRPCHCGAATCRQYLPDESFSNSACT